MNAPMPVSAAPPAADAQAVLALARPDILALAPYASARTEFSGEAALLLNANESPWPASGAAAGLNRYPDPQSAALRRSLAALYGVAPEQVLAGRGSDEAIDLLVRAFCAAGSGAIVTCPPTFGMYEMAARIQGARVCPAPLRASDGFALDLPATVAAVRGSGARLVFVCTPNNPTGTVQPLAAVRALAEQVAGQAVVVVDEAYGEFSPAPSATTLLGSCPNVVVLRTLSKAHALAGARVGALVAAPEVVALLARIQAPYPLPTPSVAAALAALTPDALELTSQRVGALLAQRERLAAGLAALAEVEQVLPSAANFITVRWADAVAAYQRLLAAGVVVRDVSRYPGLAGCLRITVGSAPQVDAVLAALNVKQAS